MAYKSLAGINAGGSGTGGVAIQAQGNVAVSGTVSFSNANNVSFGMDVNSVITASVAGAGAGGPAISAGTQSVNTGTLAFVNSNGVSFGMSGSSQVTASVAAQTNQTEGVYVLGNTVGASSSSTFDARTLSMNALGIVSAGWSNGSLEISATQSNQALSAANGSFAFQTASFSNANGVSFITAAGSAIVASVAAQSNQSLGVYGLGNTAGQSSSSTIDARSFSIEGTNGISVGLSNGSFLISGVTTAAQTNQTLGVYALSNTTGASSSSTIDARSFSIQGAGIASVGLTNGSFVISVPSGGGAGGPAISAGTNSTNAGTVVFSNSHGVSFGMNTNGVITVQREIDLFVVNNTTGQSSSSTFDPTNLFIAALGGISVGADNGFIDISGPQYMSVFAGTNSASQSIVSFANGNGVTFGMDTNGTITASIAAQSNQTDGLYFLGNTVGQSSSSTYDARSLSISATGISAGWSNGSMLLSATQSNQALSAGNGSFAFQTASFSNANGVSFSTTAGSAIIASVAAQSNQTDGIYLLGNTVGQSSSSTFDARTLSITATGISAGWSNSSLILSVTQSNQALSAGNGSFAFQTASFSNANGVSFSTTAGSAIIASVAAQSNQTLGVYALSNTTGASTSSTIDARSFSIQGAGIASVGLTNGSFVISVPSGGGAAFSEGISGGNTAGNTGTVTGQVVWAGGNNITLSGSTNGGSMTITVSAFNQSNQTLGIYGVSNTVGASSSSTFDARSLSFEGAGAVSVGATNGSWVISAPLQGATGAFTGGMSNLGNTFGTSGGVSNQLIFVGTNAIQLSQSVNGQSATLSIDQEPVKRLLWPDVQITAVSAPVNGSESVQYLPIRCNLSATRLDILASFANASNLGFTNTTGGFLYSMWVGLYSNNNSTLSSISTGSVAATVGTYTNNATGVINGPRLISCPFTLNVATPGDYFLLVNMSSAYGFTNNTGGPSTNANGISVTMYGGSGIGSANNFADFGGATANSVNLYSGMGLYSVTSNAVPATINLTGMNATGVNVQRANYVFQLRG